MDKQIKKENTLHKVAILLVASIVLGLLWNQIHPNGIKWRMLRLSIPGEARAAAWRPMSTEAVFRCWSRGNSTFIDIRPMADYQISHIPGADSHPFSSFFNYSIPTMLTDTVIIYDAGVHSHKAHLVVQAFKNTSISINVSFLRNGFTDWIKNGLPSESAALQ
ncbi:hypothetical protein KAR48_14275 [bacterium]|nr:hypothetical protein [bacterium]